jgi:transitional endoplasmic reticulum ATPase
MASIMRRLLGFILHLRSTTILFDALYVFWHRLEVGRRFSTRDHLGTLGLAEDLTTDARFCFKHIAGMVDTKARLLGAARQIMQNHRHARNGILLWGEAGNGKATFAEAVAGTLGVPFVPIVYTDATGKWGTETPPAIKAAFSQARRLGRAVLFIDRVDAFLVLRRDGGHGTGFDVATVMRTEMAGVRGTGVVLVAATASLGWLDGAAISDDHFAFRIEVPAPDLEARRAILRRSVGEAIGFEAITESVLSDLAVRWQGFSARRLSAVGRELANVRGEGAASEGRLTLEAATRAMRRLQGSKGLMPREVKGLFDIAMPTESRDALHDLAFKLRHVYQLQELGGRLPRTVLFYGPRGTGKTQAAMALAAACEYALLKTCGEELLMDRSAWERIVTEARELRPAIVFIKDAEYVLGEHRFSEGAAVANTVLSTLRDSDEQPADILYIAATSRPDALDYSALRGSGLDYCVKFGVASAESHASYVRVKLRAMAGDVFAVSRHTIDCAVFCLRGLSIADVDAVLQRVIDAAATRRLREGTANITLEDIRVAIRAESLEPFS